MFWGGQVGTTVWMWYNQDVVCIIRVLDLQFIPLHPAAPYGSLTVDFASCFVVATCARRWACLGFYLPRRLRGRNSEKPPTAANVGDSAQIKKPPPPAYRSQQGLTPLPLNYLCSVLI